MVLYLVEITHVKTFVWWPMWYLDDITRILYNTGVDNKKILVNKL